MRIHYALGFILLTLAGCASRVYPTLNTDYANEQWRQQIETNPNAWTQDADAWFLTGGTTKVEADAPETAAISTMQVKVPQFTTIRTNGSYQVQLFGAKGNPNSVFIYGPNAEVRQVNIQVRGNMLCLDQGDQPKANLKHVIVRIGVGDLNKLTIRGSGSVEGLSLNSTSLILDSKSSQRVILSGSMNVKRIISSGNGNVTVLGANTPQLDVMMSGEGTVNVSGNVGIRRLMHEGIGDFNLIGANSDGVTVCARGSGKLGFSGNFDIKNVEAHDHTCVLMMSSQSQSPTFYLYDQSKVGVAGWTNSVTVYTYNNAKFLGRYLSADNAYVRAANDSHINVAARSRIFAAATDSASIYYFGESAILTQFVSGHGVVVPMWDNSSSYKDRPSQRPVSFAPVSSQKYDKDAKYRWVNGRLVMVKTP